MPAHSSTAGSVILDEAFASGKMHDSSGWNGLLRNKSTPSDIDLCFDNRGSIMYIDLSVKYASWEALAVALYGQWWLYQSAIRHGPHCAVVCKHGVTPQMRRKIDTLRDIERFQVMVWDNKPVLSPIYDGTFWQAFVMLWMNSSDGPLRVRQNILGKAKANANTTKIG